MVRLLSRPRFASDVGDLLEAKLEKGGRITLTPTSLLDQHIEEGLEDIREGRTYGPFETAEEMIDSLKRSLKQRAKARRPRRSR